MDGAIFIINGAIFLNNNFKVTFTPLYDVLLVKYDVLYNAMNIAFKKTETLKSKRSCKK